MKSLSQCTFIIFLLFSLSAKSMGAVDAYKFALLYRDCKILLQNNCKKPPPMVQLQVDLCKVNYAKNNCEKRKQADSEQWRYLDCNPYAICQMTVDLGATSNSCFVGLLELPRQIGEGAITEYKSVRNFVKTFDAKKAQELKNKAHKLIEFETYSGLGHKVKEQVQSLRQKRVDVEQAWIVIRDYFNNSVSDYQCLSSNEKQRLKCSVLADVLSGVAVEKALVKGGAMALEKATTRKAASTTAKTAEVANEARNSSARLASISKASDKKRFLVENYGTRNVTSEAENIKWRKYIEKPGKNQKAVTIENINLKEMNDVIFKDEQYVTSITNLYKQMQMDRLRVLEKQIQAKNPNFKFNYFSDFKTVRIAYDDIPGVDISKLLGENLAKTNTEFAQFTVKEKLVRASDKPASWFKASSHKTDDMSNLVSRYSREHPSQFFIDGAKDPKFKVWAQQRFTEAQTLHNKVLKDFKNTDMVTLGPSGPVVNRDLFEIMRKNKDAGVAKAEVERSFGLKKLSDKEYTELRDYFNRADNFAPGLRNTKREFATLAEATHGGISIDMIGLGADHIQSTSGLALGKAKNIDELLVTARKNEQTLTADINRRKLAIEKKFKEATGDPKAVVTCSGDGCKAFIPGRAVTKKESDRFVDMVTQGREEGRLRFAEVTKMDDPKMYDFVAKQGEDIEKMVRKKLVGTIEPARLRGMNISVKIQTSNAQTGAASIRSSRANSLKTSNRENEKIQEAFRQVVKDLKMNYQTK